MIQFDGENKEIILSVDTEFQLLDIYSLAREWESETGTIIFHNPFNVSDELLFTLRYGWKFKPSGYSANTQVKVSGKITTTEGDNEIKTTPPTTGQPVTWQFDTPATAVIRTVASETVNVWHEPATAEEIAAEIDLSGVSVEVDPVGIREEIDANSTKLASILEDTEALPAQVESIVEDGFNVFGE
jgi:hypothetical protein